ncbi:hypothetical protein BDV93DRAFT_529064 [Ceratobasidium sp. AG-I]|nr:hypothetical protein BDV93DRAFT_529064 [Ceratobasidium sp. AG-I]
MPPKKNKKEKMSLGDFLVDDKFGSWADEMENLPTAPAARAPGDDGPSDRFGRGASGFGADRDFSGRGDRGPSGPPREDLPLPTAPPYTVFVGNLAFDIVEDELAALFAPESLKSVKVIRDRDEKPKGFGYVEFDTLDGLKNGLAKSGTQLNSRTIRVSVAEPPKERERGSGFTSFGDDASTWRREGPLAGADSRGSLGSRGSRFDDRPPREPQGESIADTAIDWRANRPARPTPPPAEESGAPPRRSGSGFRDAPPPTEMTWERKGTVADAATATSDRPGTFRRASGFSTPREGGEASAGDAWSRGPPRAPVTPAGEDGPRRGPFGGRGGDGPPAGAGGPPDAGDWRSQMKSPAVRQGSMDKSPTSSQPQTPQANRKRLDLLPRSTAGSNVPSPLSSPRMAAASGSKSNPFGAARPIDVSAKEREIAEKLEKERESRAKDKPLFGSSRPAPNATSTSTPRSSSPGTEDKDNKEKEKEKERERNKFDAKAAQVRSQTSFAAAAAKRKEDEAKEEGNDGVDEVGDKLAEVTV